MPFGQIGKLLGNIDAVAGLDHVYLVTGGNRIFFD